MGVTVLLSVFSRETAKGRDIEINKLGRRSLLTQPGLGHFPVGGPAAFLRG